MSCVDLKFISSKECMGNSLSSINGNFAALSAAVCDLSASVPNASLNVFDSPTIDLDWNASTRTLSANASYLLTLINTLSTNMQTIGNYPYLEYGWVTAPNAGGQSINTSSFTTLNLTTEVADLLNNGDIGSGVGVVGPNTGITVAANQFALKAGTYAFEATTQIGGTNNSNSILLLYDVTNSKVITRGRSNSNFLGYGGNAQSANYQVPFIKGQFQINAACKFELQALGTGAVGQSSDSYSSFSNGTSTFDQRVTIRLWKVG